MAPQHNPVEAPDHVHALLDRLHRESEIQEAAAKPRMAELAAQALELHDSGDRPSSVPAEFTRLVSDKFIALDQDKCEFLYQLIRATGATNVVEAGTSYGVSTIYLALAVGQNKISTGRQGAVIATEHEPEKAAKARAYWNLCGDAVERNIDLRVGDLLQTLKSNMPSQVDLLLLDIWTPLALPTLKLVQPHLRHGALVFTDNTIASAAGYRDLLAYLRAPGSGFSNATLPFARGFEMSVYLPK